MISRNTKGTYDVLIKIEKKPKDAYDIAETLVKAKLEIWKLYLTENFMGCSLRQSG